MNIVALLSAARPTANETQGIGPYTVADVFVAVGATVLPIDALNSCSGRPVTSLIGIHARTRAGSTRTTGTRDSLGESAASFGTLAEVSGADPSERERSA